MLTRHRQNPLRLLLFLALCVAAGSIYAQAPNRPAKNETPNQKSRRLIREAQEQVTAQKFEQAIALYKEVMVLLEQDEDLQKTLPWMKPEQGMATAYVQWSVVHQKANNYDKALEVLEKGLEALPENAALKTRHASVQSVHNNQVAAQLYNEGNNFLRQKKYPEAIEKLKESVELRPDLDAYRNALMQAYEKNEQYTEAAELLKEQIDTIMNHPQWDQQKRFAQAASARKNYTETLLQSGLGKMWVKETREKLADAPTSAALHNYLGDLLVDVGDKQVALAHFLIAAVELDEPDFFVRRVFEFPGHLRDQVALTYYRSLIYHLPSHPRSVQAVDRMVQQYRSSGRRFAFTDEERQGYTEAAEAAAFIARQPDLSSEQKNEAEFRRIQYHYEPLEGQMEAWQTAIEELKSLQSREGISKGLEERISKYIADIHNQHLNQPEQAYRILLGIFNNAPDESKILEVSRLAFTMPEIPEPVFLEKTVEQVEKDMKALGDDKKDERTREMVKLTAYEAALASWYFEKGAMEKAQALADQYKHPENSDPDRKREERRFDNYIRGLSRSFYASFQQVRRPNSSDFIEIREERVFSTERTSLGGGKPAHAYGALTVRVPDNLVMNPVLKITVPEQPAVSDPPVFFIPEKNQKFAATWRTLPLEPAKAQPNSHAFALSSYWDWEPLETSVSLQLKMLDQGEDENQFLCEITVHSAEPYRLKIDLFRWTRLQGEASPKPSSQKGQTLLYENQEPATEALGRTYRIPINRPANRTAEELAPAVELSILRKETETNVSPVGGGWQLKTSGRLADDLLLTQEDQQASGTLKVRNVRSEVYMLGGGGSR